jgi:uncharacterized membrane protein YuzA (DUF378 family)
MAVTHREFTSLEWASFALVVLGAINWGLVGLFDWNLIAAIFGALSVTTRILYILVGVAGVYFASMMSKLGPTMTTTTTGTTRPPDTLD